MTWISNPTNKDTKLAGSYTRLRQSTRLFDINEVLQKRRRREERRREVRRRWMKMMLYIIQSLPGFIEDARLWLRDTLAQRLHRPPPRRATYTIFTSIVATVQDCLILTKYCNITVLLIFHYNSHFLARLMSMTGIVLLLISLKENLWNWNANLGLLSTSSVRSCFKYSIDNLLISIPIL